MQLWQNFHFQVGFTSGFIIALCLATLLVVLFSDFGSRHDDDN